MKRWIPVLVAATVMALSGVVVPAEAEQSAPPTVVVGGEVTAPMTYTTAQLAALPQTTVTVTEGASHFTETGVLLETLVNLAQPAYPSLLNTKNELLRVTATVQGAVGQPITFAVGELDANFGNHPALLSLTENGQAIAGGPKLVVPGDRAPVRNVAKVTKVTVGIASDPATTTDPPVAGTVTIISGGHQVSLSPTLLARLPSETLTVSFGGPSGTQTHTETGPPLIDVMAIAGVTPGFNTWFAGVGSDNYTAIVTPAEALVGERPLLLSLVEDHMALAQPRIVPDGDVKGGRYVSGVVDIYAGNGPAT